VGEHADLVYGGDNHKLIIPPHPAAASAVQSHQEDGMSKDARWVRGANEIWTRRDALRAAAGGLLTAVAAPLLGLGCGRETYAGGSSTPSHAAAPVAPTGSFPAARPEPTAPPGGAATRACIATHDNIEGPYYRPGMPLRADLVEPGTRGIPLSMRGRVTGLDCAVGLAGVELDVWQANADGHYDNDGSMRLDPDRSFLRGRFRTDASGAYAFRTIVPGRYLNGPRYRPAHIHVKIRAPGFRPLTTQLYFPDDPENEGDPFIHRSLIMAVLPEEGIRVARFDFALAPGA
jgi:protocatechuate 3,4-dioxygenase beta subunit